MHLEIDRIDDNVARVTGQDGGLVHTDAFNERRRAVVGFFHGDLEFVYDSEAIVFLVAADRLSDLRDRLRADPREADVVTAHRAVRDGEPISTYCLMCGDTPAAVAEQVALGKGWVHLDCRSELAARVNDALEYGEDLVADAV